MDKQYPNLPVLKLVLAGKGAYIREQLQKLLREEAALAPAEASAGIKRSRD